MKVIIVGGVAGGASCAARLRRLDEKAEILMVERGPYVSYANCGLPYHVSGVIPEESSLLVATEQMFRAVFNIEVRTGCEAIAISPKKKTVELRDVKTGEVKTESYDKLVLSPGAAPIRPPLPGIDLPGIFSVRTVPDARTIREWLHRGEETKTGMDSYTGHQVVTKPKRAVLGNRAHLHVDPVRLRVGLGYIASPHLLVEFQYFARWTRPGGGGLKYTDNIWRLNFKLSGRGGLERLLYGGMDE